MMFIIGLLTLLGGLAIVTTHNVWEGWPTIITVFGWIFAIGGAARILFPDAVRSLQSAALDKPAVPLIGGTVQVIFGAGSATSGISPKPLRRTERGRTLECFRGAPGNRLRLRYSLREHP